MTHRTAADLARFLNCSVTGNPNAPLRGVASPESASADDLIYVDSPRHVERAIGSAAHCVITPETLPIAGKTCLATSRPKIAFSRAAAWLNPPPPIAQGIHPTAVIAETASIATDASVGPFAVIEHGVSIGRGSEIGAFCFIGKNAEIGVDCRLYPRVTLYGGVILKDRVIVHSGAVLGADGFGYVTEERHHWKFPQAGRLEMGNDVEIGANATIDRGSLAVTRLGEQVKIDNLVHIAHNVSVGDRTLIAAQTGIAGSSAIGADVIIGGQVGVADHCRLQDGCVVGAQAGIPSGKVINAGITVWGCPARPLDRVKKQHAWYARLPELAERLRHLEEASAKKS